MARFEFKAAGRRRGRRHYVGALVEPAPEAIDLPFTPASLRTLLVHGSDPATSPFSHQAIARWCGKAAHAWDSEDDSVDASRYAYALDVAEDVEAQWDLTLANWPGGPQALDGVEARTIQLPGEWFTRWLEQLDAAISE
jgi:hypothetical protein